MTADLLVSGAAVLTRGERGARPSFKPLDMLVEGGRITALEPSGRIPAGAASEVVDGAGRLVLPGLVNAHSHSYGQVCRHWKPSAWA